MMNGSAAYWLAPAALLMVLCTAAMAGMMMGHGHGHPRDHMQGHVSYTNESHGHRRRTDEHVLAERLARGEVNVDGYQRRLSALRRAHELDRTREVAP